VPIAVQSLTPEQLRAIERGTAKAASLWELDFSTHEVKRRKLPGIRGLWDRLWKPRLPLEDLYSWLSTRAADEIGIAHPHMIDRDTIPVLISDEPQQAHVVSH